MRYLLSLLAVTCALAQPPVAKLTIIEQENWLGLLREFTVGVCNQSPVESVRGIQGMNVWAMAKLRGVNFATATNALKAAREAEQSSDWYKVATGVTYAGAAFTIADQAGAWKIGSEDKPARWKAVLPIISIGLLKMTEYLKSNKPPTSLPDQQLMIPSEFSLPPSGCREFTMYGTGTLVPEGPWVPVVAPAAPQPTGR